MSLLRKLKPDSFKPPEEIPPEYPPVDYPERRISYDGSGEKVSLELVEIRANIELKGEVTKYIKLIRIMTIVILVITFMLFVVGPLVMCLLMLLVPTIGLGIINQILNSIPVP